MQDPNAVPYDLTHDPHERPAGLCGSSRSLPEFWGVLVRRRRFAGSVVGGLLLACLLYCLIAPNQYEATAKVALRTSPPSPLSLGAPEPLMAASILSASMIKKLAQSVRLQSLSILSSYFWAAATAFA